MEQKINFQNNKKKFEIMLLVNLDTILLGFKYKSSLKCQNDKT